MSEPQNPHRAGASHSFGPVKLCAVVLRGKGKCAYCTEPLEYGQESTEHSGTIDHVHDGQGHDYNNLVPCCRSCNSSKSNGDWSSLEARLIGLDLDPDERFRAVEKQTRDHVDEERAHMLAEELYPRRMAYLRGLRKNHADHDAPF